MQIFDLKERSRYPYEERDKNVFFASEKFKARIVTLEAGGSIPACDMQSFVIFYVIEGKAVAHVNDEQQEIREGQCMITEPATLSLNTEDGVLIAGFQING